jgi:hypothetical protein
MSTPETETETTFELLDFLCSLAKSQLQMQAMRFRTFDFGALSAMATDLFIAAIVLYSGDVHQLLNVVLALVGLSIVFAALSLRQRGAGGIGPLLAETIETRETISDREAGEALLDRLGQDFEINKRTLGRKVTLLTWAYTFMFLAVLAEGVGKLI